MKSSQSNKHHTSFDTLPIYQWAKLQESLQTDNPIFEYLMILDESLQLPKITDEYKQELMLTFSDLVYQIKSMDLSLQSYWKDFLKSSVDIITKSTQNKLKDVTKYDHLKRFKIDYDENNDAFIKYSNFLDRNYKLFEVSKFVLREDHKEHYIKLHKKPPGELIKKVFKYCPQFLTSFQFYEKTKEVDDTALFINAVNNVTFLTEFYVIEPHKITSIVEHNKFIKEQYVRYNQYHEYIITRPNIFNLDALNAIPRHNYDFYEELSSYISYKKININEFKTSVSKYSALLDQAKKDIENENKSRKKGSKHKQYSEHK